VNLAQYAALSIEEHPSIPTDIYSEAIPGIAKDLNDGIGGLTVVMDYFSRSGHVENIPLSVLVPFILPSWPHLCTVGSIMRVIQEELLTVTPGWGM
jgi:hypothetical protein